MEDLSNNNAILVKKAFDEYVDSVNKVDVRRKLWENETKDRIYQFLQLIKNRFNYRWEVRHPEGIANNQYVLLEVETMYSGICTFKDSKLIECMKYGGRLVYEQYYNGKICVSFVYPFIEIVTDTQKKVEIAVLEPSDITDDILSGHVADFLRFMTAWENSIK
jgi:hypothetical protein